VNAAGAGGEVRHPTVLHSVNLSQLFGQLRLLYQRRVRDRVRDRDRLSIKQLGGELLHQRQCTLSVGLLIKTGKLCLDRPMLPWKRKFANFNKN